MMHKGALFSILVVLILATTDSKAQKLCKLTNSATVQPSNSSIFIQHFSSGKCLRVEGFGILPESTVVLDECSWNKVATKDQQYYLQSNSLNKTTIRMDSGRGESYCLASAAGKPLLKTSECNPSSFEQSWTLKPVTDQPGQFLVEQYSSKKCLKPKSSRTSAQIQLEPCNAYQTEQIWKVCS